MKIVYNDEHYIAVIKKRGLSTVPLSDEDKKDTLLTQVLRVAPEVGYIRGKKPCECGALHRLDNETTGIVIFAKTYKAYHAFEKLQKKNQILKTYKAYVGDTEPLEGFIPFKRKLTSDFRSYGPKRKSVRPVIGDKYTTRIMYVEDNLITINITKGFRHQIRCHLAWKGKAIEGDKLYGSLVDKPLQLYATALEFTHPITKVLTRIEVDFDSIKL